MYKIQEFLSMLAITSSKRKWRYISIQINLLYTLDTHNVNVSCISIKPEKNKTKNKLKKKKKRKWREVPGGPGVKNPPSNAGDVGLIPS